MRNVVFVAKIHCVADSDCINTPKDVACLPFSIIPTDTEKTIRLAIADRDEEFVKEMVEFGMVRESLLLLFSETSFEYVVGLWFYSSS